MLNSTFKDLLEFTLRINTIELQGKNLNLCLTVRSKCDIIRELTIQSAIKFILYFRKNINILKNVANKIDGNHNIYIRTYN